MYSCCILLYMKTALGVDCTVLEYSPVGGVSVSTLTELRSAYPSYFTISNSQTVIKEGGMPYYNEGQRFTVKFADGLSHGTAFCGPAGSIGKGPRDTLTTYQAGKGCWCRYGLDDTQQATGYKWVDAKKTTGNIDTDCRVNCPSICANKVATDSSFRKNFYGNTTCVISEPDVEPCQKSETDYCSVTDECEYELKPAYSVGYTMESGDGYCIANPNEYTILLSLDGLDVLDEIISIYYGTAISGLPIPFMDGYSFQGWFDENGNEYKNGTIYSIADDMILIAKWGRNCDFPVGNAIAQTPAEETILNLPLVSSLASQHPSYFTYSSGSYKVSEEGMSIYNEAQRFSVRYENGLLWGTAFCGPNGSGDRTKLYYTNENRGLTAYQSGKGCWCRYGLDDAYITDFPWERATTMEDADVCRSTCPSVCARYTATDSKFRTILLNEDAESGTCPIMDTAVQCEEITGYYATYNPISKECEYKAQTYKITLSFDNGTTTIDVVYDNAVPNIETPLKENYAFAGYYTGENGTGDMIFDKYGVFVGNIYNIPSNLSLYAYWTEDFCTDDDGMVVWNGVDHVALTAELLDSGVISKKDSSIQNEYIINDFQAYTSDTRWAVYFTEYGYLTGSAMCGTRNKASYGNVVEDVVTGDAGATVSQAYSGCWCRYGDPVPDAQWVAATDYYKSGDDWASRTDACRLDCPRACANAIATDADFRRSIYGGENCPLGSDEPVYCIAGQYMNNGICTSCPDGTTSSAGASGIEQCIGDKILHVGDDIQMNLTTVKPQTPRVMAFDVLGELYYGGLSETPKPINKNTDKQYRVFDGNEYYWLHDYTVQE